MNHDDQCEIVHSPHAWARCRCAERQIIDPCASADDPAEEIKNALPVGVMGLVRAYAVWLGYIIRPYDMLADRRRWFWQKPQRCGGLLFLCDCPHHPCAHNPR